MTTYPRMIIGFSARLPARNSPHSSSSHFSGNRYNPAPAVFQTCFFLHLQAIKVSGIFTVLTEIRNLPHPLRIIIYTCVGRWTLFIPIVIMNFPTVRRPHTDTYYIIAGQICGRTPADKWCSCFIRWSFVVPRLVALHFLLLREPCSPAHSGRGPRY